MSYWLTKRDNLWSSLDELALLVGLARDPDESDESFIRRITDRLQYPPGPTKQGLVNALSVEFGLSPYTLDDKRIFVLTRQPETYQANGQLAPITVTVEGSGQLQYVEHASSDTPAGWVIPPDVVAYNAAIDVRVGNDDPPSGFILWKNADGLYSQVLEFVGPTPQGAVRVEYEVEDSNQIHHPWADFSHPDDPQDIQFKGRVGTSPDVGTSVRILDPEELALNPGSVSRREVAALWRRLYGLTWDTFRWDQYTWGDAALEGSGRIDNIVDAVAPTGYADYVGGTGPGNDLQCIGVEITPSSWMPQITPGTFYVGNRPFYLYEQRQDAALPGGQAYLELSGVAWGHPVSVTDPTQYPSASGSYQQGDGGLASTTDSTYLSETTKGANFGATNSLIVGALYGVRRVALLRFPSLIGYGPQQIPPRSQIVSASLFLNTIAVDAGVGNVFIYRLFKEWLELGADWNTTNDVTTWSEGGASETDVDYNAEPDDPASILPTTNNATYRFNAASGIQVWADGVANYGWLLVASGGIDAPPTSISTFASDDHVTAALRPALEVQWRDPTLLDSQWSPRYGYGSDPDQESSTPWSHRHIPNLSMLSGVADGLTWAPSGGQFWTSMPDWTDMPASGPAQPSILGLQLGDGAPANLTVSFELADPSGVAVLPDLDVNPTTSWMYHNKLLVLQDTPGMSGHLTLFPYSLRPVARNGIVELGGILVDTAGAPIPNQTIMLQASDAVIGDFVNSEGDVISSSGFMDTYPDGTFHFRVKSLSQYDVNPMTFWAEAREMDMLSNPVNVDKAIVP